MKTTITSPQTITPSWQLVAKSITLIRNNIEAVIYLSILPALVISLGAILAGSSHSRAHSSAVGSALQLIGIIWTVVNFGPLYYFQLRACDDKPLSLRDYYKRGLPYSLRLLGYSIVFGVLIILGLVCLLVPGFIVFRRYLLAGYFMVDGNEKLGAALKASAETTKPVSGAVWGVVGVQMVYLILAAVLSLIPVIGAVLGQLLVVLTMFLYVLRYRELVPAAAVARS